MTVPTTPPAAPAPAEPAAPADPAATVDPPEPDPEGAEALGDPGKKALDEMKGKWQTARTALRPWSEIATEYGVTIDDVREALAARKGGTPPVAPATEPAPDLEEIQRKADRTAAAKANERILRSEIKAAAAGKLADPSDAYRYLDLKSFEVDADGNVDESEVADAIADLLTKRPYLAPAVAPAPRFQGGGDGGAMPAGEKSLDQQIADAVKAGDIRLQLRLQNQKLLNQP